MKHITKAITLVTAISFGAALAQEAKPKSDKEKETIGTPKELVEKLHILNTEEIRVGKLAEEKGTTDSIREYGRQLVRDHQENDRKLKQFAEAKGIQWKESPELPREKKQLVDELERLEGKEFDRTFSQEMHKGHEKAVQMMTDARESLKDAEARELVANTIPVLREHLELAKGLQRPTE